MKEEVHCGVTDCGTTWQMEGARSGKMQVPKTDRGQDCSTGGWRQTQVIEWWKDEQDCHLWHFESWKMYLIDT